MAVCLEHLGTFPGVKAVATGVGLSCTYCSVLESYVSLGEGLCRMCVRTVATVYAIFAHAHRECECELNRAEPTSLHVVVSCRTFV